MKRIYLIKVVIQGLDSWFIDKGKARYKQGDELIIPVVSNNSHNAVQKFETQCNGSEYPSYVITGICKCDDFLFSPIGFKSLKF